MLQFILFEVMNFRGILVWGEMRLEVSVFCLLF